MDNNYFLNHVLVTPEELCKIYLKPYRYRKIMPLNTYRLFFHMYAGFYSSVLIPYRFNINLKN